MSLRPGARVGPYEVTALIGEGGMGEVWRAHHTALKRDDALKVLPDAFVSDIERLARFRREAQVLASLNHPNIAHVYGLEQSDGVQALVMELVEGPTLADRIARGAIPLDEALPIAQQIAEALEAAHERGIVHRDLKPSNIKVREDGTVKILDFGLAKALEPNQPSSVSATQSPTITTPAMMTGVGVILGTAAYMSPEQAKSRPADKRSDIWAFGCILYEMLSGRRTFAGDDLTETLASVIKDRPDLSKVPPRIRRLIAKCLEKDPKERLRDIGDVWALLDSEAAPPQSSATQRWKWRLVAPAWTLAGILALALASLAIVHLRERPPEQVVVRTTVPPPEDALFDFDVTLGPVVISPDGRQLAFTARSTDGRKRIWIRPLDSLTARPLDGTDDALFPFWSPDGRWVGFYGSGRLFKVDVGGGAPIVITEMGFVRGASWGGGGTIILDGFNALWTVPASGGPVVRRTTPDSAQGETGHRSPWFLPDGQHYLYWVGGKNQVRVGSLDSGSSQVVTEATSNAIYSSGHLLFLREATLLAQPFDSARLVVTGEAVPLANDVSTLVGEPRGVFTAADNGTLVYQTGRSDAALSLEWFDRSGRRLSTITELGDAGGVELSPDGKFALAVISDPQRHTDLWRVDLANGRKSRLTSGLAVTRAVWSPDGREVVYTRTRDGRAEAFRKPSTGVEEGIRLDSTANLTPTSWSTDGKYLLLQGRGGLHFVQMMPKAPTLPSTPVPFASNPTNQIQNPRFSPDGRWVAYQADQRGAGPAVFVEAFPNGGTRQQVAEAGGAPRWRPDGKELYYVHSGVLWVQEVSEVAGSLQLGAPNALLGIPSGRGYPYDVPADGQRFLALATSERRAAQPLTVVQNWVAALKGH